MKLELKHLAPYLPYGLNTDKGVILGVIEDFIVKIGTLKGEYKYNSFKPILRPLSDFVSEELYNQNIGVWCDAFDEWLAIFVDYRSDKDLKIIQAPYVLFEWFLQTHFDVFGLIEKGLAIDINTLNTKQKS